MSDHAGAEDLDPDFGLIRVDLNDVDVRSGGDGGAD
jgi:hypothetical protein